MLSKGEKKNLFEYFKKVNKFTNNILSQVNDWNETVHNVEDYYNLLIQREKKRVLKRFSLDDLSKIGNGMPVTKLKRAGYTNMSDLLNMNQRQLMNINGIGNITARKILQVFKRIEKDVDDNLNVNLNELKDTRESKNLLNYLRTLLEFEDMSKVFKKYAEKNYDYLLESTNYLRKSKRIFNRFFMTKKKKGKLKLKIDELQTLFISKEYEQIVDFFKEFNQRSEYYNDISAHYDKNSIQYITLLESIVGEEYLQKNVDSYLDEDLLNEISSIKIENEYFKSRLRTYQVFGVQYLLNQKQVLLGDDMGLGKTVQALAVMSHLKSQDIDKFLVVVPLSVLINWEREINKHTHLISHILYSKDLKTNFKSWLLNGGVALTTYGSLQKIEFHQIEYIDYLVVDEANYIKNPDARRSNLTYELISKSKNVTLMTGTPIENNLEEMINLIYQINTSVGTRINNNLTIINPQKFRNEISSVYLRRTRESVLKELPEISIINEWVNFTRTEYQQYVSLLKKRNFHYMRRVAWLKEKSSKLERLVQFCEEANDNKRKVVVYSYYLDVIARIYNEVKERATKPITGNVSAKERQEIFDEFEQSKDKNILVSQVTTGGMGINLQFANIVILCEPQIKPSMESQAIARVHRMGQTKGVIVYRLLTENSLDEYILKILDKKQQIFDTYAEESIVAIMEEEKNTSKLENMIIEQELKRHKINGTTTTSKKK